MNEKIEQLLQKATDEMFKIFPRKSFPVSHCDIMRAALREMAAWTLREVAAKECRDFAMGSLDLAELCEDSPEDALLHRLDSRVAESLAATLETKAQEVER